MPPRGPSHGGPRQHSPVCYCVSIAAGELEVTAKLLFSDPGARRTTLTLEYSGMNLVFLEMKLVDGHPAPVASFFFVFPASYFLLWFGLPDTTT